ncbi:3-keto-5-aminohexanoate cleavage protein [Rhodobacter sp. NTK016B]|uniref:3-keto-5-aminohexanoate cleavage protein n=1 Tax=Rhodobacter sp. NTK016B TaxID=2759676 RepID=UPI001A8F5088|nr:3-keto-5-aminohexanoate cleavage protein [Rhodobacter sp. NTK016B]MBN8291185.1 3-keto-5-aminohexanoate cleavage protein [Rhodobacter sp. NTK016B]
MSNRSVIITCAVTGSMHTPSMSPYLPITPDQIAAESVAAAEAGASVIHLHARDPETGKPTGDPEVFRQFLPRIKQQSEAIINISTGGAPGMTLDQRLEAAEAASPEMTSLNMGSINNGLFAAAEREREWLHDWERPFLTASKDGVFKNTFADIEQILERLGKGHGTRFEFECYDVGHLYNIAYCMDRKLYEPPLFLQFIFGILGGIGAEVDHLVHMLRTAERLFGKDFEWSVLAAGRHQIPMNTHNLLMGGNVRVGLEDSLRIGPGKLAQSNAEQVAKIRRILEELSFTVATPKEARERLATKGGDQTAI